MPPSLSLGPLTLPTAFLVALAAYGVAVWVADRFSRRLGADLSGLVWRGALLAVVAARLGFVWQFRAAYAQDPLDVLNLRDGGWEPQLGWAVAWVYTLAQAQRHPAWRKALWTTMAAATAVWLAGAVALWHGGREAGGVRWPELRLPAVSAQAVPAPAEVPLSAFQGRPVVMNLWATWCPPCRREMPVLQRGQQAHADVHYVFVNQGESAEKVQAFLREHGVQVSNVLLDRKGALAARFGVVGYPTTLFFDAQGRLVSQRVGELSWATLSEKVQAIREAQPPGAYPSSQPQH
jgi:thiol-disulfide isomerase/thioredoxin